MFDVPSPIRAGQSVELTCSYKLDDDSLYSVKWYKDNIEFYRYVPKDWPPGQFLPLRGVRVELSKSGEDKVYLNDIDLDSEGRYRCEVSAEAPSFQTVEASKDMKVFVLPTEGPRITGGRAKYNIGDTVTVNCTSAKSKPAATLRWYINEKMAEHETDYSATRHEDGLESSSLSLKFIVTEDHLRNGNMKLTCESSILRSYVMSNEELVMGGHHQASGLHISENLNQEVPDVAATGSIHVFQVGFVYLLVAIQRIQYWMST
ncbi:cell adhesion molecule 2-like [Limulus polyphemus]|uniref:Cell adhesion molecule 2-like n=1 Tax=Limulus polyphemus TaxID=6850 RepID=A0ABM1TN86_LIMPO|nr:cell adhesion molecule 2-like [Limulus polyphemus]